jgi:5-methylcytosine-specific restriction endonuclease McrA
MSTDHEKLLNRIRSKRHYLAHTKERRAYMKQWNLDHRERRKEISIKYERSMGKIPRNEYFTKLREKSDPKNWRGRTWWKMLARRIKERDLLQCQRCFIKKGQGTRLVVHHFVPVTVKEDHSDQNLTTLCNSCHLKIHRRKDGAFLFA